MRKKMTLEDALEMIRAEYERAIKTEYIRNPLAYALYQVWKKANEVNNAKT